MAKGNSQFSRILPLFYRTASNVPWVEADIDVFAESPVVDAAIALGVIACDQLLFIFRAHFQVQSLP
jgi:hypothetical protein